MSIKCRGGNHYFPVATQYAAAVAVGILLIAANVSAETSASIDDWLKFDRNDAWNPGFDRSSADQAEAERSLGYPTLSPENIDHMKAVIKRYASIVERGGWNRLPLTKLHVGMTHPAVAALRQRLRAEGDLREDIGQPETFDYYVEKAVKAAQIRHGLKPTGVVNDETIKVLNVPSSAHLRSLRTNLTRIEQLAAPEKGRYILVNIPAAQVEAVEDNRVVSRHAGVVGKPSRPTPILESKIQEINFNKEWILPPTVIREDLLPKAHGANGYKVFESYGIDAYANYAAYQRGEKLDLKTVDWSAPSARNLFFAQAPGRDNPLGFMKINFFNSYAVYMHDTPSKALFSRNDRAESSGCIRVQNISRLAAWLLRDSGWNQQRVLSMKQSRESLNVPVKGNVQLYFAYVTAWATPDGTAHFRRDIYKRDGVGVAATAY